MRDIEFKLTVGVLTVAMLVSVGVMLWLWEQSRLARQLSLSLRLSVTGFLPTMRIRVDALGDGHFNTTRTGHVHQGTDVLCRAGQTVTAPFAGRITRTLTVYPDSPKWTGLELQSLDVPGTLIKLFYVEPLPGRIGRTVAQGESIASCQAISQRYTPSMQDHVHVEVRQDGKLIDPETFFQFVS